MIDKDRSPFEPTGETPDLSDLDKQRLAEDAAAFARAAKKDRRREARGAKEEVQEASEESFPASDPPSFTPNTSIGSKEKTEE